MADMNNWSVNLAIVFNILAVIGFLVALGQTYLSLKQQAEAKRQTNRIVKIQQSLSTKSIGEFPSYMTQLIGLIQSASASITIVCDYMGYGLFSNREKFLEYAHAIQNKINAGVDVRYILLDKERRSELHDDQFEKYTKDEETWKRWREDNQSRLKIFCKFYAAGCDSATINNVAFKTALEKAEIELLNGVFRGSNIKEIKFQTSVYFWIRDQAEVIFTIPSFSEESKEFGFRSIDEPLIRSFLGIYDRYRKTAEESERNRSRLSQPLSAAATTGEER